MSVNYDNVCRLCMSTRGEILPIYSTTSSDDPKPMITCLKIKDCVDIVINQNDVLPKNICRKCLDYVDNWYLFKISCERTQNKLQSLIKKDGSQLEEVRVKSEPLSDGAYDDGVASHGYADSENAGPSSKVQSEGPPILASLGLTPRSDKGMESEKEEEMEEEGQAAQPVIKSSSMPEVSITVMRPTGETLQPRHGIQQLASKDCLVCGRSYRYSHNARRHELSSHNFDRYTNKVTKPKPQAPMLPKLRPNPFNPKARLMPNPNNHKMKLMPKAGTVAKISLSKTIPSKPIPIKPLKQQNSLPYPLRIKALKDLQIKRKEPQIEPHILKTLLTAKPEVLVSEPEIMNSGPESPETLISEPEISFQVETILTEPDGLDQQDTDQVDGDDDNDNNHSQNYDTVDMDSDNEIEIAHQKEQAAEDGENVNGEQDNNGDQEMNDEHETNEEQETNEDQEKEEGLNQDDSEEAQQNNDEHCNESQNSNKEPIEEEEHGDDHSAAMTAEEKEDDEHNLKNDSENNDDDDEEATSLLQPMVELNEGEGHTNSMNSGTNEDVEDELEESTEINDTTVNENDGNAEQQDFDPNKIFVTKTQKDFIEKYRHIIQQINTKRCLCCNKEHPRRKSVIQHLQKNGHKVPKHTCYNCVVTFQTIGALLSHMRANICTDLWKIIYDENGITDDMIRGRHEVKVKPNALNSRSYACKLCPAKYQLKTFIVKHVLDVHEDGQSQVPLVCVHCGSRFKDKEKCKRHIRKGECIIYIICDVCSERFENLQYFNDHAMTVHADNFDEDNQNKCVDGRPTDCPLCEMKSSNYQNLVKHLRLFHDEDKPYFCTNCDAKFDQMDKLNKHIYDVHSDKAMGITEPDMSLVKEEVEEYHYSCTECNAIFETVDAWTDHQVAEHNQVAHHCDQCEKKFLRPSELAEHKNTHLRVKFYPCSVCTNSYSTPQKLSAHVQQAHQAGAVAGPFAQTPETEFYCEMCIRSFKSRQAYSNHMRIHAKVPTTNRKPGDPKGFAPSIIGKSIRHFNIPPAQAQQAFVFKQNSNVPAAPYSCDICGKGFMHKKNIWKHKKILHADLLNENKNDSEENTMQASHASTEDDEYVDENGALSTPQFDSFNFSNFGKQQEAQIFTCDVCYGKFSCKDSLKKHKRAKHGTNAALAGPSGSFESQTQGSAGENSGGRSSCTICKITFADKKSYYRHRKNVHKSSMQMCKICGKPLNSTLELYEHLKAAHARELLGYNANQGASKPQTSRYEEETEQEYDGDQDSVDPGMDYQARYPCNSCGRQFVGLLALQNHQCVNQISSEDATFDCEICHKSYTSIAALKSHRGWHLRSPDGKAAANNTGLWMPHHKVTSKVSKHEVVDPSQLAKVQHVVPQQLSVTKRKLPPEVEVTVVNPNKKMRSDDSEEQLNSSGGVREDRYCTVCDKEFTKRAAYQRHMEEVHQPNSVFCPVCNKSFTRKSTLLVHMKKHYESGEGSSSMMAQMEEDLHSCDVCDSQFDNPMSLTAHKARHHGEEESDEESEEDDDGAVDPPGEFTCAQCGDGVATPRDLIAHRTIHATPTKYFCNVCKVYFAKALDLSTHTRARHSEGDKSATYPCAMCDRFYMNKKSLQRHIEMSH